MFDPRSPQGARWAAEETAARAEIDRCHALVTNRNDSGDTATRAWREAIARWHVVLDRIYPVDFWKAIDALKQPSHRDPGTRARVWDRAPAASIEAAIRFLEADLICFRSGYVKERLLRRLARQPLQEGERQRLRAVVLAALLGPVRREYRAVCSLAAAVGDDDLLAQTTALSTGEDAVLARRAGWMRDAIERGQRDRERRPRLR